MTDIIVTVDAPLEELAAQINAAHFECEQALKAGLGHALKVGKLLVVAKQRLGHGNWLSWLKANVTFSDRTAQGYMRVAKRWTELEAKAQRVADLPYRQAVALLCAPTTEEPATSALPPTLA